MKFLPIKILHFYVITNTKYFSLTKYIYVIYITCILRDLDPT